MPSSSGLPSDISSSSSHFPRAVPPKQAGDWERGYDSNSCGCPVDMAHGAVEEYLSFFNTYSSAFDPAWSNRWQDNTSGSRVPVVLNVGLGNNWLATWFAFVSDDLDENGDPVLAFVWKSGRRGRTVWFSETSPGVYAPKYGACPPPGNPCSLSLRKK